MTAPRIYAKHEGSNVASAQMDRDLELARAVSDGTYDVAFRTYTWSPWAVSLGRHQSAEHVQESTIRDLGYHLVTRPTGGRAVLHAEELTYCLAVRTPSAKALYSSFHDYLLLALEPLVPGKQLSHTSTPMDLREHYRSGGAFGQACFAAHAPTEIVANGRKVVGSAQRVLPGGVVLMHGSILCGPAHMQITSLIRATEQEREHLKEHLEQSSVSLQELGCPITDPSEVANAVHAGISSEVLRSFQPLLHQRMTNA